MVLILENEDNLEGILYKFQFNMVIFVPKKEALVLAKEPRHCKLELLNETVNRVIKLK